MATQLLLLRRQRPSAWLALLALALMALLLLSAQPASCARTSQDGAPLESLLLQPQGAAAEANADDGAPMASGDVGVSSAAAAVAALPGGRKLLNGAEVKRTVTVTVKTAKGEYTRKSETERG